MDKEPNDRDVISVNPEVIHSMRRNSTRKTLSLSSVDGKIISRYLKPSLGSCHDFCKYGRKDAAEAESKHPFFRRSLPNIIIKHEEKNQVESLKFGERRQVIERRASSLGSCHDFCTYGRKDAAEAASKHPFFRRSLPNIIIKHEKKNQVESLKFGERRQGIERRDSSQLKFEFSDTPEINKKGPSPANGSRLFQKHVNVKLRTQSFPHKSTLSAKPAIFQTSSENEVESVHLGEKVEIKKGRLIKLKTKLHQQKSADQPKVIKQQDKSLANEINAAAEPDIIDKNTALHVKKSAVSVKPRVFKQKTLSSVKESIATTKFQVLKQKASSPLKRIDLSAKPAISLKKKTTVVKGISILNPLCNLTGRRNQEAKVIKSMGISKIGEKKVLKPSTYSSSPKTLVNDVLSINPRKYRNVKFASPMKSQGKIRKTEHVSDDIKEPKSENIELNPIIQNSENYQSYPSMAYTECQVEFSNGEDKRRQRRTATVHPVGSLSNHHKLRFRRGKVLDIQPQNNGPRRLRFKKGRMVVPNPNGYVEVGAGSVRRGDLDGSVSNDPGSEALVVQLKHQDMLGKKDSQGLFNHVIEETATKLVETRKSKVKALVGAFETVISLQESKPASAV